MAGRGINENSLVKRNNRLVFSEVDGEIIMISLEQGKYYGLETIGTEIWHMIKEPFKVKEIIDKLLELYEVSYETCSKEVKTLLDNMNREGLVHVI